MRGHVRSYRLKDGEKRWAVIVYQGRRVAKNGKLGDFYRWTRGFRTQKAAQSELNKILKSLDEGLYIEPSKQTVSEYLERWLTAIRPNLAGKTFERYKQLVEININPKLGAVMLFKLHPVQISEFYTWLLTSGKKATKTGLSPRTVLHIHRLLRKALKQAVIWQLRPTNPADAVEAPRPPHKEMNALDGVRSASLLQAAENTEMYLPILIALCTGMRRGEILSLRWRDLDLDNFRLTVHQSLEQTRLGGVQFKSPKTKQARRTIALPEILVSAIKEHAQNQQKVRSMFGPDYPTHDLVISLADGAPWPPDRFTDAFVAFVRKIEVKRIRFHDLRHTHATELLRRGVPIKVVSQRLGHANPSVTLNVYAHVMSGDDEKAADLVEELFGKQKHQPRKKAS